MSFYGARRSEILGAKWSDVDGEVLSIRRGRVAVGTGTVEGPPKSRRSRRDLPLPPELAAALRSLKLTQKTETLALGVEWSDDRLIAVDEAGTPIRRNSSRTRFTGCVSAPGCAESACTA